jgi:hypothetical protein
VVSTTSKVSFDIRQEVSKGERSLEVIRIYRGLVEEDATRPESQFAFYLDEPALVTLGVPFSWA